MRTLRRARPVVLATVAALVCAMPSTAAWGLDKIYFSDWVNSKIQRANLDGSVLENIATGPGPYLNHVAVDPVHGTMYWTRYSTNQIGRANLDGTSVTTIFSGGSFNFDIDVDAAGGKIYWADTQVIRRANLDGTGVQTIVGSGGWKCLGLDLVHGKLYFGNDTGTNISRANLDGSSVQSLIGSFGDSCMGLEVDPVGGKIYLTTTTTISRANLDGTALQVLQSGGGTHHDIDLDLPNGKVYWPEWNTNKIRRMNLDGTGVQDVIASGTNGLGIAVLHIVCGNGVLEAGEQCDDGNLLNGDCCSSTCQYESNSVVCRAAAGSCDLAETCTGASANCPADAKSTALCRAAAGACDLADFCNGVSNTCPADAKSTATCRSAGGVCDLAEVCDGVSNACPADAKSTTTCRGSAGVCDVAEACDGVTNDCPADAFEAVTTVCRAGSPGEVCDVPETCPGTGPNCPADAVEPSGTVCRASSAGEVCDVAETCDGASKTCPADAVLPSGTPCRPSAGICDIGESCDGSSKFCPSDAKSTAQCRAAAGVCDVAESCDGVGNDCLTNGFATDGTNCDDALYCNGVQTCSGGVCGGSSSPCTMGQSCDEALDQCFVGDCPTSPAAMCRTADKNTVLIKNKSDNTKDKLVWKWIKGDATSQAEFGDPTDMTKYALCFYAGATAAFLDGASVPPAGGKWSLIGSKGYKYADSAGSNGGITKIIVKGGADGKAKALVKGKGGNLPDFDSDLPIDSPDLPLIVQLRNNRNGLCWQGSFAIAKKNQTDQFKAKTP